MIWTTYSAVGIRFNVVPEQMVDRIRQQQKDIELSHGPARIKW